MAWKEHCRLSTQLFWRALFQALISCNLKNTNQGKLANNSEGLPRPRAATSVATRIGVRPSRKSEKLQMHAIFAIISMTPQKLQHLQCRSVTLNSLHPDMHTIRLHSTKKRDAELSASLISYSEINLTSENHISLLL